MIKEITVTKEDFKRYSKFAFAKLSSPKAKGWQSFVVNFLTWFVIAVIFFALFQSDGFSLSEFHWPSALATSIPFIIFIIVFIFSLKKIEKNSIPKENGLMPGKRTIEIDESGIKDINSLATCKYKWKALEEIVKHEGNVYLFLDTTLAQIIPSSAFESPSEMDEFVENVEQLHNKSLHPTFNTEAE